MNAYVIPVDRVIGLSTTTPSGWTVTSLADEHTTCLAAQEYNRRQGLGDLDESNVHDEVWQLRASILTTLRSAGHRDLAEALADEAQARKRLTAALLHGHAEDLDAAVSALTRSRAVSARYVARAEMLACVCVQFCAEDPATACGLSGREHVHPDDGSGTFGRCLVHPDRPGDH